MATRRNGRSFDCVVVDINTQRDFCDPDGACPVVNAYELMPALRRMIAWAKRNYAPVISSLESLRTSDERNDGRPTECCLDGSVGQQKVQFTTLAQHTSIEVDNTLTCPIDLFGRYQQVIFRKRTEDLLGNPKADRFFTQLPTQEFLLFGVGLEHAIKALALGLLAREKTVTIIVDACGYWNRATADLALRQVVAKGANVITVSELLDRRLDRGFRYSTKPLAVARNGSARNGRANGHPNGQHNGQTAH